MVFVSGAILRWRDKAEGPLITTQCIRVPVEEYSSSILNFKKKPTKEEMLIVGTICRAAEGMD